MSGPADTPDRTLGRLEARVQDLTLEIANLRRDLAHLLRTVEGTLAAHHERLRALEAFRRWAIGLMTGLLLSGVAALFGRWLRT